MAGGLGRYMGIDPVILRVAFVVLTLAGLAGILVYIVGWIAIPEEKPGEHVGASEHSSGNTVRMIVGGSADSGRRGGAVRQPDPGSEQVLLAGGHHPAGGRSAVWRNRETVMTPTTETQPTRSNSARIILGALILLIGVAWMLEIAGAVDEIPWSYLLPAAVMVIGVGLIADSRGPTHGGLVFLGIILTLFLLIDVSVSSFNFTTGDTVVGPATYQPATVEELEDYGIFAGELTVDLSQVVFPVGETTVNVNVFAGSVKIIVPSEVTIELQRRHVCRGDPGISTSAARALDPDSMRRSQAVKPGVSW